MTTPPRHSRRRRPAPGGPGLRVTARRQTPDVQPPAARWLGPALARAAACAGVRAGQIALLLVDDAAMCRLHERHLREAVTTDVLTFDLRENPADAVEGDIVICLDEARRQAARRGHPARLEALLYAVHGLLHLLGHDDHTPAGARRMHQREDELLRALGYGAVFAAERGRRRGDSRGA